MTAADTLPADRMERAWRFVSPACPSIGRDWKDPIRWSASESALRHIESAFAVTLADMVEAIAFFTATRATVTWADDVAHIEADGYRMGPAGDH
tara:strand:- start:822 stop:1103 length:282 start_codon:yes stop_codon:yes gene_type:complete